MKFRQDHPHLFEGMRYSYLLEFRVMLWLKLRRVWHARNCTKRLSLPFFYRSFKSFYHTIHQVMSPDCKAYSLKKYFIKCYTLTIVYLMPPPSLPPAKPKSLQCTTYPPSTSNQMLLDTFELWIE